MLWLLRMKRWVQSPPSPRMIKLGLFVIGVAAVLYTYETFYGWPDWLTVNETRRGILRP